MGKKRIEELANKYAACRIEITKMLIFNVTIRWAYGCIMDMLYVNFHGADGEFFE